MFLVTGAYATNGTIKIIKDAQPNHTQDFTFTTTGGYNLDSTFILDDDGNNNNTRKNFYQESTHLATYTVKENITTGWTLASISCTEDNGVDNSTVDFANRRVIIRLEYNEKVTCTFVNRQAPTAADVTVSGQTVRGARIYATSASTGQVVSSAIASSFGYYTLFDLKVNEFYIISVTANGQLFEPKYLVVTEDVIDVNFLANPPPEEEPIRTEIREIKTKKGL